MAATPSNGLASLLDQTREGTFTLPLPCFMHAASGRPLRHAGILEIRDSIKEHGWLGTPMTVCLIGDAPDGGLTPDIADSRQYRMVNGNHRLAALLLLEKERPPDSSPTMITVDVHVRMTVDKERWVASSLNTTTEMVVKTTLCDKIEWHKTWYDDIKSKKRTKAPLASTTVATQLYNMSRTEGLTTYSLPTIKGFMKAVEALKPRGSAALHDVTHLSDRREGHPDLKDGLQYKRVTLKSLLRPEFSALTDVQQEAYVYRLASGAFPGVMTEDDFKNLDKMAAVIGRMVVSAETNFTPVDKWTPAFKEYLCKVRNYEPSSKFVVHFNARDKAATEYKTTLPIGMAASQKHEEWIKHQPWPPLLAAMRGSETSPNPMQEYHDNYVRVKKEFMDEAAAAEGRFKTKVAEKQKAATDAANAAAAAKAATEKAESAAAAAEEANASKEAADAASAEATQATVAKPTTTAESTSSKSAAAPAPSPAFAPPTVSSSPAASTSPAETAATTPAPKVTTVVGVKRKAAEMKTTADLIKAARPIMAKLVDLDLFGAGSLNTEVDIRHPANQPFMMAFVNVASNASVLTVAEEVRLKAALGLLADNLHDRGTIVVALPDWNFEYNRLQALFSAAELTLEQEPVVSVYLHGKRGRVAKDKQYLFQNQGSVNLVAHKKVKDVNIVCNGGGPRSKADSSSRAARATMVTPPRTAELDQIGVIPSMAHPPAGTFLADSTAEFLIKRFSDAGDTILVSAVDRDRSLSNLVLQEGRALVALVPDMAKLTEASTNIDSLAAAAAKSGMWAKMLAGPVVTVGPNVLPALVPPSNVPPSTTLALSKYVDDENPELRVAMDDAAMYGLEIKASETHGNGLFVTQDFVAVKGFIPVPLVGRFEVHDNEEGCWQAVKEDGVPRFLVLPNVTPLLSGSEVARPTSALYLVPDKTSPLFYVNSSATDVEKENFAEKVHLKPSRDFRGGVDVKAYLGNPQDCVSFNVTVDVSAGTELLAYYKFEEDVMNDLSD